MDLEIRRFVAADRTPVAHLLDSIEIFSRAEVAVALELVDIYLANPAQDDYRLVTGVDAARTLVGYACYGPVPLTSGTFDLYWLAVAPSCARRGAGTALLRRVEEEVRRAHGRLLQVQTSGRDDYAPTRAFYRRSGYGEVARFRDYFRRGDDAVIFEKRWEPVDNGSDGSVGRP